MMMMLTMSSETGSRLGLQPEGSEPLGRVEGRVGRRVGGGSEGAKSLQFTKYSHFFKMKTSNSYWLCETIFRECNSSSISATQHQKR